MFIKYLVASFKIPTQRISTRPTVSRSDTSRRGTLINGLINSSKDSLVEEEKPIEHFKNSNFDIADKSESFENYYTEIKILGEGTSSVVKLCVNKSTNIKYAVKCLRSNEVEIVNQAKNEFKNLKIFENENIIKVYEMLHNKTKCIIHTVLEYCDNSQNLTDYIKSHGPLNEIHSRSLFKLVLNAIEDMHREGLCHRDLKPDNVLIINDDQIRIIDFNISKKKMILYDHTSKTNMTLMTHIGTLEFSAPETLQGYSEYSEQVDMWGAGLILYFMLSGENPFKGTNLKETIDKIIEGNLNLDCNVWENISHDGLNILRGLLKTDPNERLNCYEAINHPWFKLSAVKIIKKKFKGNPGIFGDSLEEDFRNMTITPKKYGKVVFAEFHLNDSNSSENEETSHNFFSDYKNDVKYYKKRRSDSI